MSENFLDIFQEYVSGFSSTAPEFIKYTGIMGIGALLGNRVYYRAGARMIYPNLWVMFIADSGVSYKSEAPFTFCQRLCGKLEHYSDIKPIVYPTGFSYESLQQNLEKQPAGIYYFDEYSTFLKLIRRTYADNVLDMMTSMFEWGGGNFKAGFAKYELDICNPAPSFITTTTKTSLLSEVKIEDLKKGFMNRFIYVLAPLPEKSMAIQPSDDKQLKDMLHTYMIQFSKISGEVVFDREADDHFKRWYDDEFKECNSGKSEYYPSYFTRLQRIIKKIALIYQINSGEYDTRNIIVTAKYMDLAMCECDFLKHNFLQFIRDHLSVDKDEAACKNILNFLKEQKESEYEYRWVSFPSIMRATHKGEYYTSKRINDLLILGDIEIQTEKDKDKYRYVKPTE